MIIATAAAEADFTKFQWYSAKAAFTLDLDSQSLRVAPDDLVGLNKTSRGPTAGKYQVVMAKYPQITMRAIEPSKVAVFAKHLKPYAGVPEKAAKTGKRRARTDSHAVKNSDKMESQFYRSPNSPKEHSGYDRDDYQWRKLVRKAAIKTRHFGKSKAILNEGEVVGLRYLRKSHGGYIIMPNEERIMIDHETYENLVQNSDVLPYAQQRKGLVAWDELAQKLPKATIRPQKYKVPMSNPDGTPISPVDQSFVKENKPLVSEHDYSDMDDEEFDFEDDDEEANSSEEEFEFEEDDDEDDDAITVNHPEDDHMHDVAFDDDGEEVEDEDAIYAKPGRVLIGRDNVEWAIVSVEESGLADNLLLYSEELNKSRHYKVPAGEDLRDLKSVTVGKMLNKSQLRKLLEKAADNDPEIGKRM